MFQRPVDMIIAAVVAVLILLGSLWGLSAYVSAYHRPVQNWLPQGSFRGDSPLGWTGEARVSFERTLGHVPLNFVKLQPGHPLTTELPLLEGWRLLHVAVWYRTTQGASLRGDFGGSQAEVPLRPSRDGEWHLAEGVWVRPNGTQKLILTLDGGPADVAEVSAVPSYVYQEGRRSPAY